MAVKTVTLAEDAYEALAALKGDGESFSQVVRRLTGSQILLSAYAGAWIGADPKKLAGIREFLRESKRLGNRKLYRLARTGADIGQP